MVERRVQSGLVKPLAEMESSRFSRARPAPKERRVRVLETTPLTDDKGRAFLSFAVDVRFGGEWHDNDIVGCAYLGSGELFVKKGEAHRPAAFLLGKDGPPVPGVCQAVRRS